MRNPLIHFSQARYATVKARAPSSTTIGFVPSISRIHAPHPTSSLGSSLVGAFKANIHKLGRKAACSVKSSDSLHMLHDGRTIM